MGGESNDTKAPATGNAFGPVRDVLTTGAEHDGAAVLFSVKCYVSAILAYYLALQIGLERPYWALTTCFITAAPQPLAGAILTKAVFRVFGTVLGSAAAVVLVPNLVDEPAALVLALALWLGLCICLSQLDRTPRAHMFMLAGFTASIISFPSIDAPGTIFNVAILRVQEITLGILCAVLLHGAVFPRTLAGRLAERVNQILADSERWARRSLLGQHDAVLERERRGLALEVNELLNFSVQLPFDTARDMPSVKAVNALQDRLMTLLPLLVAIEDRVAQLQRLSEGVPQQVRGLLLKVCDWLANNISIGDRYETAGALMQELRAAGERLDDASPWRCLLSMSLLARLSDLVGVLRDARALRDQICYPRSGPANPQISALIASRHVRSLSRDYVSAMWTGVGAGSSIVIGCAIWIATAWPSGSAAATYCGVVCSVFASVPNAHRVVLRYLVGAIGGVAAAALYSYIMLPRVSDPIMLAVTLAPVLLVIGSGLARASSMTVALAASVGFFNMSAFASTYEPDFASFANASIALMLGIGFGAVWLRLFQSGGAGSAARRLLRAEYRDVARRADGHVADRARWTSRMLDRVGLLSSAMSDQSRDPGAPMLDGLTNFHLGVLVGALGDMHAKTTELESKQIGEVLAGVSRYYKALNPRSVVRPPGRLLLDIDRTIDLFESDPKTDRRFDTLALLTGVRRNLFSEASAYVQPVQRGSL